MSPTKKNIIELCTEAAAYSSASPHDFLLAAMHGEPISQTVTREVYDDSGDCIGVELSSVPVYPSPKDRIDCAKALLPYTMPRLSVQVVQNSTDVGETLRSIKELSDEQLYAQIQALAYNDDDTPR